MKPPAMFESFWISGNQTQQKRNEAPSLPVASPMVQPGGDHRSTTRSTIYGYSILLFTIIVIYY